MCFSATASFVAGTTLCGIGVAAVRNTQHRHELPFAMIPLLFGVQQLTEGVVWLTFGRDAPALKQVMTYAFASFAYVIWPAYAPFALGVLEKVQWRRRAIFVFLAAGIVVSLYLLYNIVTGPLVATIVGKHIVYVMRSISWPAIPALYLAATCVSGFFSSHIFVRLFGVLALLAAIIAYIVHIEALASIWCFFAAVLSTLIYCHLRFRHLGGFPLEHSLSSVNATAP